MVPYWDPRTQPCLAALTTAGLPSRLGLIEAFEKADDHLGVGGRHPGETLAMLELLRAVAYAADVFPETSNEWRTWVTGRRPLTEVADWLREQPEKQWNFFHPDRPLFQNALLAPFMDEHGVGTSQIVMHHVGDYVQLFDRHHLHHGEPLAAADAFLAVITQHVCGNGGRGMIPGSLLGAALNNQATCRAGTRVHVTALGQTLGDTLRLNLHPHDGDPGTFNFTWTDRPRRSFTVKPTARTPDGPADLHSILGRSILTRPARQPDGTWGVDRVLMGAGDIVNLTHASALQDAVIEKNAPLKPSAARALWREAHSLYAATARREKGMDLYGRLAMLPEGHRVTLWTVGLLAKPGKLIAWVNDAFPYIPGRESALRQASEEGCAIAAYVAAALDAAAYAAWRIAYPNPKPSDKQAQLARFKATGEHFAATEPLFHELLDETAEGTPVPEALATYAAQVRVNAEAFLTDRLRSLPPSSQGYQANTEAREKLAEILNHPRKAPAHLRMEQPA
ncbi:type I-E CRISPR-associated protein Cse1/CasA [Streptomyces lasalocidi]|uniref:Type I-E CRISPR-associated protein Cse1/CasA n=1 Tax=Streptomyces lasalocidi TaxID=324833 RepID=A0A4U5W4A9_STRLS|nr:type I-E CRISPR-associated protein Cse1/CasA [Streptomyces lasalocidi]TKS96227.1 type I-E CRISPR-associated protein Cse1/CasA [Streptomyces lasalocidi]